MANSLQEQLLKAGLVTEQQINDSRRKDNRSRKQAPKPAKKARKASAPTRPGEPRRATTPALDTAEAQTSEYAREVARKRAAKIARDRRLNQDREAERERRARRAQVLQLLAGGSLNDDSADVPYNFVRGKRIKRLYVTRAQHDKLTAGTLVIVGLEGSHHVVEPAVGERVRALAGDAFVHRASREQAPAPAPDAEDPYAAYQVPDDLIW